MKSTALEIAKYIYNKGYSDNLKINKLLYISFGFYGARNNGNYLFNEKIEAWNQGPVVPDVYHSYHNHVLFQSRNIKKDLSTQEKDSIDEVLSFYGEKAPFLLSELTHQTESPWSKYYVEGKKNIEIVKEDIISYYQDFLKKVDTLVDMMSTESFKDVMRTLSKI